MSMQKYYDLEGHIHMYPNDQQVPVWLVKENAKYMRWQEEMKASQQLQETIATLPEPATQAAAGLRYDSGKPRMDLLPPDAMLALAQLYTIGAAKYAERNWEKGMKWSKVIGPLLRHTFAWMRGRDRDEETGCHHMIHVAWNALALYCYCVRKLGEDDRNPL